jgi:GntR family transcriptional regulator
MLRMAEPPSAGDVRAPASPGSPLLGGVAPLYRRLRQALHDRMRSGEWQPGDRMPSIRELGESYGVSHITVVRALDDLTREGLLLRRQGRGVFVSQARRGSRCTPLQSFTEEIVARGRTPSSRTLRRVLEHADPGLQTRLGLRPDDDVILLERLRMVDGLPLALQRVYLPAWLAPGLVERSEPIESLYRLLADTYGVLPTNAFESYQAISLDSEEARLLEAEPGLPAFRVTRTTSDQHGRTIEFASSVLRGDRYEVHLNLRR